MVGLLWFVAQANVAIRMRRLRRDHHSQSFGVVSLDRLTRVTAIGSRAIATEPKLSCRCEICLPF
jgi:hypothetical protein